ncbi:hypothetical protein BDR03DRAFT_967466 [Suillus americanus]|nr:hypothetical protein BDR03DRAFT_967466 [Suillus americanus]
MGHPDSMKLRQRSPAPGNGAICRCAMCREPTMEILRFLLWSLEKSIKSAESLTGRSSWPWLFSLCKY